MTLRSRVGTRRGAAITGMALLATVTSGLVGASNANALITKQVQVKVVNGTGCVTIIPEDGTRAKSVLLHGGAGWKSTGVSVTDGSRVSVGPWTGTSLDSHGRCNGTLIRMAKSAIAPSDRNPNVEIDLTTR